MYYELPQSQNRGHVTYDFYIENDEPIRAAVKCSLLARQLRDANTVIWDEFPLYASSARIDIAVVDTRLTGYEIKSDGDSLARLDVQSRAYNSVFDRMVLVVGYRLAFDALRRVPDWWGIVLVSREKSGTILFSKARRPRTNPHPNGYMLACLLWRSEALSILEQLGVASGLRSKPKAILYDQLIEHLAYHELRERVCSAIKQRAYSRVASEQTQDDD